jgi:hypothetical protein
LPHIFDNITGDSLAKSLNQALTGAKRADFCIGYFNLRGWNLLWDSVEQLGGSQLDAQYEDDTVYKARILVGMHKTPQNELEEYYALHPSQIEFYPKKSKPIIDEIDKVHAKHYGFTDEELDFIINYDIKYRMGSELEGEE